MIAIAPNVPSFNLEIAANRPAQLLKCLCKELASCFRLRIVRPKDFEYANDACALGRLCIRCNGPGRCAAKQRHKLAPSHHSITSSAISRKSRVIARPSALAAFRLITSSNLVGCCTGNDWVGHGYRDDGDCPGRLLRRARRCRTKRDNDIGLAPNQFGSQLTEPIRAPICKLALYGEVLSVPVTELLQSLQEGVEHVEVWIGKLGAAK